MVKFKGYHDTPVLTKNNHTKHNTIHAKTRRSIHLAQTVCCIVYISYYKKCFLQEILDCMLLTCARGRQWCGVIHYHWWTASIKLWLLLLCFLRAFPFHSLIKLIFRYSIFSTFIEEDKNEIHLLCLYPCLYPSHFKYKRNGRKMKGKYTLKRREKRIPNTSLLPVKIT